MVHTFIKIFSDPDPTFQLVSAPDPDPEGDIVPYKLYRGMPIF